MKFPCRKLVLGPPYVGPFKIEELVSPNSMRIESVGRFKAISPFQNIKFLRPYHQRTSDIGPISHQASKVEPAVDSDRKMDQRMAEHCWNRLSDPNEVSRLVES